MHYNIFLSDPRTGHFLEDRLMLQFTASTGIIRYYYPNADKYNFGCIIQYSLISPCICQAFCYKMEHIHHV